MDISIQENRGRPAEPDAVTRPNHSFDLRDAVPADSEEIFRLVHALAIYERMEDKVVATAEDFRTQLFGLKPRAFAMVAEMSGRIVGMAIYFFNFSTFHGQPGLYLEDIFVEPEWRGNGIGRAFFAALARRALSEGCSRMEWSVLNWNAPSIAFYRSLGAVGLEEWTVQRLTAEKLAVLAEESARHG
jgi:GNAT superfamily N-acetyltransferase